MIIEDQVLPGIPWDTLPLVSLEHDNGVTNDLVLVPSLPPGSDQGLVWKPASEPELVQFHTLGTKLRMMVPMLNDQTRNASYERAINLAVKEFQAKEGRGPKVLDIGAGTGLLSLIAARAGARQVLACEMNPALAAVVKQVVQANSFEGVIKVVDVRSTDVSLEQGEEPFDLIVTETLDSDLLNEGIIESIRDAFKRLGCPSSCQVIPNRATVFAQAFGSKHEHAAFSGINAGEFRLDATSKTLLARERSDSSDHPIDQEQITDLHLSLIPGLLPLSESVELFHIDFAAAASKDCDTDILSGVFIKQARCLEGKKDVQDGDNLRVARMIVTSWELYLSPGHVQNLSQNELQQPLAKRHKSDNEHERPLSTGPHIGESDSRWQDHWFPVVHPLRRSLVVPSMSSQAEFQFEFHLSQGHLLLKEACISNAECGDGAIIAGGDTSSEIYVSNDIHDRRRASQLADSERNKLLSDAISDASAQLRATKGCSTIHVVDFSDGALCSALALVSESDPDMIWSLVQQADCDNDSLKIFWRRICDQVGQSKGSRVDFVNPTEPRILQSLSSTESHVGYVMASDLYYSDLVNNGVLGAFRFLNQTRNFAQAVNSRAPLFAAPRQSRILCALAAFPRLARSLNPPREILGFHHAAASTPWNRHSEMLPVPVWSYGHQFLTKHEVLAEINYGEGTTERGPGFSPDKTLYLPLVHKMPTESAVALIVWMEVGGAPNNLADLTWWDRALIRVINPLDSHTTAASVLDVLHVEIGSSGEDSFQLKVTSPYFSA